VIRILCIPKNDIGGRVVEALDRDLYLFLYYEVVSRTLQSKIVTKDSPHSL
jgi:hypothetical protein